MKKNDAHYTFYKDFPEKRLNIEFPLIERNDIVQCGSFYAVWDDIRDKYISLLENSTARGGLIYYDPNFRKSHVSEIDRLRQMIIENMKLARIVRGTDEDFSNIFGTGNADEAWESVRNYCNCLVYTANAEGVYVRTKSFSGSFPVKKITPVSTIGAGVNFQCRNDSSNI